MSTGSMSPGPAAAPAPSLHHHRHHREVMTHREILESLSGLLLALFVAMLSNTVVSNALPKIIGDLKGTQTQYTWVITATLLTATASTPIWGKLADLFSKKVLVQTAIVVFVAGSMVSGLAQNAGQLIAARAFQGIGAGGLQTLVQIAIAAMIPPRERGRYNGYLGGVMAVATVGGPLLGGVIVDTSWLGWRWCFYVGVPFAVVALILLQATLHLPVHRHEGVRIDYAGAAVIAAAVSVLLIWVTFVDNKFDWLSWQTFTMVGGSLVLFAIAVVVEAYVAEPVVPLNIVRQRTTALSILASLAVGIAMFGGVVFISQYLQVARGYTPTKAGLITIPLMGGVLTSSIVIGRLVTRTGRIKPFIIFSTITMIAGFAWLSTIDHETSLWALSGGMILVGIGVGGSMQNLVLAVQNTVPQRDIGAASSAVSFFRSLGGAVGVSVLGAVLAHRVTSNITKDLAAIGIHPTNMSKSQSTSLDLSSLPPQLVHIVRVAFGDATGRIFLVSTGVAVVGLIAAAFMPHATLRSTLDLHRSDPGTESSGGGGQANSRDDLLLAATTLLLVCDRLVRDPQNHPRLAAAAVALATPLMPASPNGQAAAGAPDDALVLQAVRQVLRPLALILIRAAADRASTTSIPIGAVSPPPDESAAVAGVAGP